MNNDSPGLPELRRKNFNLVVVHAFENSNTAVAEAMQLSVGYIGHLRKGRKEISSEIAATLEQAAHLAPRWMDRPHHLPGTAYVGRLDDFVRPANLDPKKNSRRRPSEDLAFSLHWLEMALGLTPDQIGMAQMPDRSMERTFHCGDTILFDKTVTQFARDDIYALERDDELTIKRLQRVSSHVVRIISDNAEWPPVDIDLGQARSLPVLGRYCWHSHLHSTRDLSPR